MQQGFILACMSNQRLREQAAGYQNIDRAAGVIRGVKVLGASSKNRRTYLREAVERAAPVYEGAKIFIDHTAEMKDRPTRERWGRLVNVSESGGELFADLEYIKSHPMTEAILEAAERFNDFGLSHDATGKTRKGTDGSTSVYEIVAVHSVDVVQTPATNKNLFESAGMAKAKLLQTLRENVKVPAASKLLARMVEMEDVYDDSMEMDMEVEEMADSEPEDAVAEAFRAAVLAILDMDSSVDERMDKIRMLLDAEAAVSGSGGSTESDDEMVESEELKKLRAELSALKEEKIRAELTAGCRKLLESSGREVTDVRVRALAALSDDADRKLLVESWSEAGTKPARSPGRLTEGAAPDSDLPTDIDGIKKLLRV